MATSNGISSQVVYSLLQQGMSNNYAAYGDILTKMSANTKLTSISDDPVAAVNVLKTEKSINNITKYLENIGLAKDELRELDDMLGSVLNKISTKYKPLALQASNGAYNKDAMKSIVTELEGCLEELVSYGNTKFNGNYVFSGANTKTQTFTIEKENDGTIKSITYHGSDSDGPYQRFVQTDEGEFVAINTTGEQTFGSYDKDNNVSEGIIGTMVETINTLKILADENSTETEISDANNALYALLNDFDTNISDITTVQAKYASTYTNMEMTETAHDSTKLNLTSYMSSLKDIDMAEMSTELYNAMYAYQASMSLMSQVYQTGTLLNYI